MLGKLLSSLFLKIHPMHNFELFFVKMKKEKKKKKKIYVLLAY